MNIYSLWSLRLGFSNKQAADIERYGFESFLKKSLDFNPSKTMPKFLENAPKNLKEMKQMKMEYEMSNVEERQNKFRKEASNNYELKAWWLNDMFYSEFPLREKMTCFWHNHFVTAFQKVKINHWIYQHNQILYDNAFGNFKELTKMILKSNAIIMYLDNKDNKKGAINENLSRELLELFTIGIGNYTENDVKEGAKALAGLTFGEKEGQYRKFIEDNSEKTYFGKKGNWKADDLVNIIFEQKQTPYLLTEKILKWFLYDEPSKEMIKTYGDYFRKENYEIKPLLQKIFSEEYKKNNQGQKIKDPLTFTFQLFHELNIKNVNFKLIAYFLRNQQMDIFNQPNVKGWKGGKDWLTTQLFLQRNNTSDSLISGKIISRRGMEIKNDNLEKMIYENPDELPKGKSNGIIQIPTSVSFKKGTNKEIIKELTERLLFSADKDLQKDMESILKYDFDPDEENAQEAVKRLLSFICKTPEFQLI